MNGLLLDTHVWLWYAEGIPGRLSADSLMEIENARRERCLYVSAISLWEIGLLVAKGRIGLSQPLSDRARRARALPGLSLRPLDADIALESTQLPGELPGDPADRFLIATARLEGFDLVTADGEIPAYACEGHVRVRAAWSPPPPVGQGDDP
jgi:PIN domain nuclease of toxin-antitoxin system